MEHDCSTQDTITARSAGMVGGRGCAAAWPEGQEVCGRCGASLRSRDPESLQRVWAWWVAGVCAYVPANSYPMLRTSTLFGTDEATIVGGAMDLFNHGSIGIAAIIVLASVGIPVAKFLGIAFLALSVRRPTRVSAHQRHVLFSIVEYIGRWSMIDVFVVAILSALVQFSAVATIEPGPASLAFALSVIFTMLSAQSFDPRMIWDSFKDMETHRHDI